MTHSTTINRIIVGVLVIVMILCITKDIPIREGAEGAVSYYALNVKAVDTGDENLGAIKRAVPSIQTMDGFDGYSLDSKTIKSLPDPVSDATFDTKYGEGGYASKAKKREIGQYLTHFSLYKTISAGSEIPDSIVVVENTVRLSTTPEFTKNVLQGIQNIKAMDPAFDIAFLADIGQPKTQNAAYGTTCPVEPAKLGETVDVGAYIISATGLPKLLSATTTIKNTLPATLAHAIQTGALKAYSFCPPIATKVGKLSK